MRSDGWEALWAHGGATHELRTYVASLAPSGASEAPLGTVQAPTVAAARTRALARWPGAGQYLRVADARVVDPELLARALALDVTPIP